MRLLTHRHFVLPLAMGLLLALVGFSYSLATTRHKRVAVVPPACTLPTVSVVSGADSDTAAGTFRTPPPNPPSTVATALDLGGVVCNREFTRIINVRDGFPPYEIPNIFIPDNADITAVVSQNAIRLQSVKDGEGARLRAATPEVQPPPAALDASLLPQYNILTLQIEDQNPDPTVASIVVDFCFTVFPVLEGESVFNIVDLTNVVAGGVINPSATGNPVPTNVLNFTPTNLSDGTSFNDLPSALQSQAYEYQLHVNGGDRFGGDVSDGSPTFVDSDEPSNFSNAITADTTSIYAGHSDGVYTLTADNVGGDGGILDLVVSFDGDSEEVGLGGDTTQTFLDVLGPGGVIAAGSTLSIGSLGVRININPSVVVLDETTGVPVQLIVHDGDIWRVIVTGLEDPVVTFTLNPDSTALPDGLRLESDGLLSGTPRRAGDYTFIVNIEQLDPEDNDFVLNRATRQLFLRVIGAPVDSQMVLTGGHFNLAFGADRKDSIGLTLFLAKDTLRDFSELRGASFDMIIGNDPETRFQLSSFVTAAEGEGLVFDKNGLLKWPPEPKVGQEIGAFKQDAGVLIQPLNPNNGSMKLFINRVELTEAIGAATAGVSGSIEVPIAITLQGGAASLDLTFEEITTFAYRTSGSRGQGRILQGPQAATLNIGQFLISEASGTIKFDPFSGGSDTLEMRLGGFLRHPAQRPFVSPFIPADAALNITLGAQAAYEGNFSDMLQQGNRLVLKTSQAEIPVSSFIIDNARGTFSMTLRAPATNAASIQGLDSGLIINSVDPFNISVRIRMLDQNGTPANTADDVIYFDGKYNLVLFRTGNKLGLK